MLKRRTPTFSRSSINQKTGKENLTDNIAIGNSL